MKLDIQQLTDLSGGFICNSAVSESKMPLTTVSEVVNFHFDKIGCATLRKGTTALGNQLTGNLLGLYEFRDSGSGTYDQIIAVNGTGVYYLNGTTWTSKRTVTTGKKADFTTFLDFVWMVNGTDATAIWDGNPSNSFVTTGNADSAPIGKFIENYRSRVWITGNSTYPDRIYYSSLPSEAATPVVTWNTSATTGDWIDISPQDGDNITALKRSKSALLVFKRNNLYRVYSSSETDPDPKYNVGTYSNESVIEAKDGIYFHHPTGIFRYSDGVVEEISKPIQDFIDAVSVSQYENVCSWQDGDHVYTALGDLTVNGVTYNNTVVRYTISSQVWTVYSYQTNFLCSSDYNDGSTIWRLVGDNDGNVLVTNYGNTDNESAILYTLTTRPYTFDGLFSTKKTISNMSVLQSGGEGARYYWKADDMGDNEFTPLNLKSKSDLPQVSSAYIKGNKIWFKVAGSSNGEPFEFRGFEILDITSDTVE
jgi:hypothetical protein